eukprot:comp5859_c0_seq1/m.1722 comp5859_c0_seq1/g.1722  ORF comp5859_c0_seq1/g.1722 comp5859_c0_seq1/m.1722 type:complete len:221 (-) comp5859_c0_seq1:821-1483(-)
MDFATEAAKLLQFVLHGITTKPPAALRAAQWLFAVTVFGCVADKCKPQEYCVFNDSGACNYAIGVGVFAFLLATVFLAADLYGHENFGLMTRPFALMETSVSGALSFLWFVGFCYLADQWRKDNGPPAFFGEAVKHWSSRVINNAQGAIVFSLFSLLAWCGSTYLAYAAYLNAEHGHFPAYDPPSKFVGAGSGYQQFQDGDVETASSYQGSYQGHPDVST